MTVALRLLVVLTLLGQVNVPQTAKEVTTTISEPRTYELAKLFQQADRVVLAKVVGGDTESYDVAVYKAEVVKNFKGGAAGETFYFGPFLGKRLGWEYILFLHDVPKPNRTETDIEHWLWGHSLFGSLQ
jgi:hypothetical protein